MHRYQKNGSPAKGVNRYLTQELAIDHGEIDHSEKCPSNEGIPPELPDLPRSP